MKRPTCESIKGVADVADHIIAVHRKPEAEAPVMTVLKARTPVIRVGQTFEVRRADRVDTYRREQDDPEPAFECERIRVTHLACSYDQKLQPYTFGTEPEWFAQRGLRAHVEQR